MHCLLAHKAKPINVKVLRLRIYILALCFAENITLSDRDRYNMEFSAERLENFSYLEKYPSK